MPLAQTPSPKPARPNQYAGRCTDCGGHVPAGGGTCARAASGRWDVRHTDAAACSAAGAETAAPPRTAKTNRHHIDCDACAAVCAPGEASLSQCHGDGGCPTGEHMADDIQGWHGMCLDTDACAARVAAAEAARAAAHAARERHIAALAAITDALTTGAGVPVAAAHPDSMVVELLPHDATLRGHSIRVIAEPATATPQRVMHVEYRGADGDMWHQGNYGWCANARWAPYTDELAAHIAHLQSRRGA